MNKRKHQWATKCVFSKSRRSNRLFKRLHWFGNTFLDKFYKVFFSLSIRSLRLPLTTSLHGYEFRRSRQIQMIMPSAFGYHTHAHYQGFASPISVADRQSVFDCPMNHGFADSSTNECSQKAEYVVRLTFQKCVDG